MRHGKVLAVIVLVWLAGIGVYAQKQKNSPTADVQKRSGAGHSVTLTWTQSPNPTCAPTACPVTGNQVLRGTTSGSETVLATLTTPATTYTDVAVSDGQTYFYKVTAVNVNGASPPSSEVSVVIPLLAVPAAPTGLTGVAN